MVIGDQFERGTIFQHGRRLGANALYQKPEVSRHIEPGVGQGIQTLVIVCEVDLGFQGAQLRSRDQACRVVIGIENIDPLAQVVQSGSVAWISPFQHTGRMQADPVFTKLTAEFAVHHGAVEIESEIGRIGDLGGGIHPGKGMPTGAASDAAAFDQRNAPAKQPERVGNAATDHARTDDHSIESFLRGCHAGEGGFEGDRLKSVHGRAGSGRV